MRLYKYKGRTVNTSMSSAILLSVMLTLCPQQMCFSQDPPKQTPETKQAGGKEDQKKTTTPTNPVDPVKDVVGHTFNGVAVDDASILNGAQIEKVLASLDADLVTLANKAALNWGGGPSDAGSTLYGLAFNYMNSQNGDVSCASKVDVSQAVIFHVTHWSSAGGSPSLVSSNWYAYHHPRFKKKADVTLLRDDLTGSGDPLIYAASTVLIVGIDRFDNGGSGTIMSTYSATVTQGTPENWTGLGDLIKGLSGISAQSLGQSTATHPAYIAAACQTGARLPFSVAITKTSVQSADLGGKNTPQSPGPGTATCSGQGNTLPCTTNRTFNSQDREYWDVGIAIATPGLRESKYTFSSSSSSVSSSVTTHTELYGILDLIPSARWLPKESIVPHFAVGVPVSSQSLYRPFFGISENFTGWTHLEKKLSLPVGINFIGGVSYMKTQQIIGTPTSQTQFTSDLTYHRVWKGMFGFEFPVSSLMSKLGKKSSNTNGSGKGGTS
jgi:hypothetical protein